jgi:predicted DNA-binding protein with PD1-like motif
MLFKKVHVFRVKPNQELASEIAGYCRQNGISSGIVIGIIGSAESAKLNFIKKLPGKYETREYKGPLEIVCAQGSVAVKDDELLAHVHIQLADDIGCWGGHLVEARIFSTAEVVLAELDSQLRRYPDAYTGLNELQP